MILSGVDSQTVTIVSSPAGTPVSGSTNTFDYPILSNVTLTCMVNPTPSSSVTYQWNTTGCYTSFYFTGSNPQCFPHGQTAQIVSDDYLNAEDAGTITCTVAINGSNYTSEPFTLRISGEQLVYCVITCIVYVMIRAIARTTCIHTDILETISLKYIMHVHCIYNNIYIYIYTTLLPTYKHCTT